LLHLQTYLVEVDPAFTAHGKQLLCERKKKKISGELLQKKYVDAQFDERCAELVGDSRWEVPESSSSKFEFPPAAKIVFDPTGC
jgi:hypothetical protein